MQSKRKFPRRDTILYLQVYSQPNGDPVARLVDLSPEGALLLSSTSFTIHTPFEACITLPVEGIHGQSELQCTLFPRWKRPDYNPEYVLTGCTMEVAQEKQPILDELISRYSFSSGHTDLRRIFEEHNGGGNGT